MRNYDEKPIVLKNNYLLKSELRLRIFFIILSLVIAIDIIFPMHDFANDIFGKIGLSLCALIFFSAFFRNFTMIKQLLKNNLKIRIFQKHLEYDYVDFLGNSRVLKIRFTENTEITYSYFPYFGEAVKSSGKNENILDKISSMSNFVVSVILNFIFILIFQCLNFLKIKKYYIFNDNGILVSVEQNSSLIDLFGKVQFNKQTLILSLINYNSKFLNKG